MEIPLIKDFVVIFGLAIVVLLACHWMRLPVIVGFLITGILCGPQGLGLVSAIDEVRTIAEIGIVVLLFSVGMEFSVKKILRFKRYFFIAGPVQVFLTTIIGIFVAQIVGRPIGESIFLGFLLSLSSTAIVMRILQDRLETSSPQGRLTLGILIFQDIAAVVMMLLIPILAGENLDFDESALFLIIKGVVILAITFYSSIQLVPMLLYYVAKTRSRELFLLSTLVICFSVAWITSSIGLSLALGAFLAGLIISESEYSHTAIGNVLPFQDVFTSLFFVSIGMLLDVNFFLTHSVIIILVSFGVFVSKGLVVGLTAMLIGFPLRYAIITALSLSQIGEFSFVLAMSGLNHDIGTDYLHQLFLSVAVISMGTTPILMSYASKIADYLCALRFFSFIGVREKVKDAQFLKQEMSTKKNHVIIVGYGFSGRNLVHALKKAHVPYVIIDMNPEIVREQKQSGEPIYFGDASRERVMKHAEIESASVVAVVVDDPIASLQIVEHSRNLNPSIYIIVRARYLEEVQALIQLGADEVIPDELGSSMEIFSRVLGFYDIQRENIEQMVNSLRIEGYEMLKPRNPELNIFSDLKNYLEDVVIKKITVPLTSSIVGKTIGEVGVRSRYNVTVLGIKRKGGVVYSIRPDTEFFVEDKLILVGTKENLENFRVQFGLD